MQRIRVSSVFRFNYFGDCSHPGKYKTTHFVQKGFALKIGQSEVPDGRPTIDDRLFVSDTVEAVILDVGSRIKDDTIRTIFTNCLPSTLGIINIKSNTK